MMLALGLPVVFVNWLMNCVYSVSYAILLNGKPGVPFPFKKGLRQGDPLSPFLFAIAMKYLSRLLEGLENNHDYKFHPRCGRNKITHLLFADDLLLFSYGSVKFVKAVMDCFREFSKCSGLVANVEKCEVFMVGINEDGMNSICESIGMPSGQHPIRYLGVPLSSMKVTYGACKPLIEKVIHRIHHWTSRFLTYAGRLTLVQSIVSSLYTFWG